VNECIAINEKRIPPKPDNNMMKNNNETRDLIQEQIDDKLRENQMNETELGKGV
jgi:hypothetical protein